MTSKSPSAAMVEAYEAGRDSRAVPDLMQYAYDEPRFDRWMEDPTLRVSFEAGRAEEPMVRWVEAERYGDIPTGGASRNHRDSRPEGGLSVARLLDGSDDYDWYTTFSGRERPVVRVGGWLHYRRGSDGEPLLVAARVLTPPSGDVR